MAPPPSSPVARRPPDIVQQWKRPLPEIDDDELTKSVQDAMMAIKKLGPEAFRDKTGLADMPWKVKSFLDIIRACKGLIDKNIEYGKISTLEAENVALIKTVGQLEAVLDGATTQDKGISSSSSSSAAENHELLKLEHPKKSFAEAARPKKTGPALAAEAGKKTGVQLRLVRHPPGGGSGSWCDESEDDELLPPPPPSRLRNERQPSRELKSTSKDFVVIVMDKRWPMAHNELVDKRRRDPSYQTDLPVIKVDDVKAIIRKKGIRTDIFQLARGVGVGCPNVSERDKLLELLQKEKGGTWDIRKDLPSMIDVKIANHGYDIDRGEELVEDLLSLNNVNGTINDIKVMRMTGQVAYIRMTKGIRKQLPDRPYVDCRRVRLVDTGFVAVCYRCGSRDPKHDFKSCDKDPICKICSSSDHLAEACPREGSSYKEKSHCKFCDKDGHGPFDSMRCDSLIKLSRKIAEKQRAKQLLVARPYLTIILAVLLKFYVFVKEAVLILDGICLMRSFLPLAADPMYWVEDNLVRTDDKWVIFMDSNAYNELWGKGPFGSTRQKTRGTKLARWIEENDVRIHNDPSMPTFIRPVPGGGVNGYQSSSIDVCLSSEVDIVGWSTVDGVRPYDHLLIEAMAVTDKASIKVKRVYTRIKDKPAYYDDLKLVASDWYHDLPDFMLAMDVDAAIADVVDKIKTVKNRHRSEHSLEVNLDSPDWWGDRLTALRKELGIDIGRPGTTITRRSGGLVLIGSINSSPNERDYGRILKKRAKPKASSLPCHDLVTKPASDQEIELVLALIDDSPAGGTDLRRPFPPHSDLSRRLSLSYGYVEGKDTSMAVQKATEVMKQLTDEGKAVIALSLDMRGAFSNARHDVICTTVEEMCGSPVLFNLVSSYLHRRRCFYKGKMRLSMSFSGTPQGGAVVEAVGRLLDALAEQLPALGLNISEEKSVLLGDKAFIERYDCVRGIKRKDGCSALSPKGREVIRNHITGVLAYGLVCWGDRLRFKTTRDRISAVDLRLEKVLLGVPGTANPGLCALLSDRKATIYERLCVRYASLWLRGLPQARSGGERWSSNHIPGWVHIGNGREVTGTITEGLAGGKVIFPEVEVVIYTDGSRTPAVDDNDDDTTRAILKSLLSRRKSQLSSDIVDLALSTDIDFRFIWVRGHAGSTGNSIADGMARSGSIVGTFRTVPVPGSHLRELEIKNKTIRSFITSNHHLAILERSIRFRMHRHALRAIFGLLRTGRYSTTTAAVVTTTSTTTAAVVTTTTTTSGGGDCVDADAFCDSIKPHSYCMYWKLPSTCHGTDVPCSCDSRTTTTEVVTTTSTTTAAIVTTTSTTTAAIVTTTSTTTAAVVTTTSTTTAGVVTTTSTTTAGVVTTTSTTTAGVVTTTSTTTAAVVTTTSTTTAAVVTTTSTTTAAVVSTTSTTTAAVVSTTSTTTAAVVSTTSTTTAAVVSTTTTTSRGGDCVDADAFCDSIKPHSYCMYWKLPSTCHGTDVPCSCDSRTTTTEVVTTTTSTTTAAIVTTTSTTTAEVVTTTTSTTAAEVVTTTTSTTAAEVVTTTTSTTAAEVVTTTNYHHGCGCDYHQLPPRLRTTTAAVVTTTSTTTAAVVTTTSTTTAAVVTTTTTGTAATVTTTTTTSGGGDCVDADAFCDSIKPRSYCMYWKLPSTCHGTDVPCSCDSRTTTTEVVTTTSTTTTEVVTTTSTTTTEVVTTTSTTTAAVGTTTSTTTAAVGTTTSTTTAAVGTTTSTTTAEVVTTTTIATTPAVVTTTTTTTPAVVTTTTTTTPAVVTTTTTTTPAVVTTTTTTTPAVVTTTTTTTPAVVTTTTTTTAERITTTTSTTSSSTPAGIVTTTTTTGGGGDCLDADAFCDSIKPHSYCMYWQYPSKCHGTNVQCSCAGQTSSTTSAESLTVTTTQPKTTSFKSTTTITSRSDTIATSTSTSTLTSTISGPPCASGDAYCDSIMPGSYCMYWNSPPACYGSGHRRLNGRQLHPLTLCECD
ncbi:hypothetical protein FOZ60_005029 [Perkinsus olseni]|uniref:Uncharacterized protein n=1 Tax=Perkinsus olseni TaxID=32597 RepID=A0A7J6NU80_PEROL|nr:hypothetical protein FOZ60_005029 [Perkinsus olseni]